MTTTPTDAPIDLDRSAARIRLNAITLAVARLLTMALNFVQAAVVFRALQTTGFGEFSFALSYPALFTAFATLGVHRLLIRDIARDPQIAWREAWAALTLVTILSAAVMAVIAASVFLIEPSPRVRAAVILGAFSIVFLYALQRPFESILIARERLAAVAALNAVGSVLKLAAVYVALRFVPTSAVAQGALALANGITLLACLGAAVAVAGWQAPRFDLRRAAAQARLCLPFLAAMVCSLIYFKADLSIVRFLRGDDAAGVYGGVQRITEPVMMLAGVWATAIFPALCRISRQSPDDYLQLQRSTARTSILLATPLAVGLAVLAEPLSALLSGAPQADVARMAFVLRIVCAAIPLFYFNSIAQEFLYSSHRNGVVTGAYGLAAAVSLAGNLVAVQLWGERGAAVAAVLANLVITLVFARSLHGVLGRMDGVALAAKTLLACAAMGAVAALLAPVSLALAVPAGAAAYAAAQYLLGTLNEEERGIVRGLFAPLRRRA